MSKVDKDLANFCQSLLASGFILVASRSERVCIQYITIFPDYLRQKRAL